MGSRRSILMTAQEKIATGLAAENVRVRFDSKIPCANVQTREIHLPPMPETITPETEINTRSWLGHETAHLLCKSSAWTMEVLKDKVLKELAFELEDCRVDRKMGLQYPGINEDRRAGFNLIRDQLPAPNVLQAALFVLYEHVKEFFVLSDSIQYWTGRLGNPAAMAALQKLMAAIPTQVEQARETATTEEVIEVSKEIKEIWKQVFQSGSEGDGDEENESDEDDKMNDGGMFGGKKGKKGKVSEREDPKPESDPQPQDNEDDDAEDGDEQESESGGGDSKEDEDSDSEGSTGDKDDSDDESEGSESEDGESDDDEDGEDADEDSESDEDGDKGDKSDDDAEGDEDGEEEDGDSTGDKSDDSEDDEDGESEDGDSKDEEDGDEDGESKGDKSDGDEDEEDEDESEASGDDTEDGDDSDGDKPEEKSDAEAEREMQDMMDDFKSVSDSEQSELESQLAPATPKENADLPYNQCPPGYIPYTGNDVVMDIPLGAYRQYPVASSKDKFRSEVKTKLGTLQRRLMMDLMSRRRLWISDREHGEIDDTRLARVPTGDKRVYKRKLKRPALNIAVQVVLDMSGSMCGQNMYLCGQLGYILGETLSLVRVPYEVVGFTTGFGRGDSTTVPPVKDVYYHRECPLELIVIKPFEMTRRQEMLDRFFAAAGYMGGGTVEGEGVWWAAKRLAERREQRKLLITVCDGGPCGNPAPTRRFEEHAGDVIRRIRSSGIETIHVGIQTNDPLQYVPKETFVRYDGLNDLLTGFYSQLGKILRGERKRNEEPVTTS